jgi:IS30 family transposase
MTVEYVPYNLTEQQVAELWDRYAAGQTVARWRAGSGRSQGSMGSGSRRRVGSGPRSPTRAARHLTLEDREEISRGLAAGTRCARSLSGWDGRVPSTVSREVEANGGRSRYRAMRADRAAVQHRRRPKVCKLAATPRLRALVEAKLRSGGPLSRSRLAQRTYPDDAELQVSHETIYRTLFVQSRGALKRELTAHLRTRRRIRQPGHRNRRTRRQGPAGRHRPHLRASRRSRGPGRARPLGGDLILGKGMSAIGTLVERSTRFVLLIHLDNGSSPNTSLASSPGTCRPCPTSCAGR